MLNIWKVKTWFCDQEACILWIYLSNTSKSGMISGRFLLYKKEQIGIITHAQDIFTKNPIP
jgi:hypothetical protein